MTPRRSLGLTSRSDPLPEPSDLDALPAELPARRRLPVLSLLPAAIFPKRPAVATPRIRRHDHPHARNTVHRVHPLGAVHLATQAVRRSHLGRLHSLDSVSHPKP